MVWCNDIHGIKLAFSLGGKSEAYYPIAWARSKVSIVLNSFHQLPQLLLLYKVKHEGLNIVVSV